MGSLNKTMKDFSQPMSWARFQRIAFRIRIEMPTPVSNKLLGTILSVNSVLLLFILVGMGRRFGGTHEWFFHLKRENSLMHARSMKAVKLLYKNKHVWEWQRLLSNTSDTFKSIIYNSVICKSYKKWRCPRTRPWRPIGFLDVKDITLFKQSAQRWRCGCQTYAPAALYPSERFQVISSVVGWVHSKAILRQERFGQWK
jgi:hypothetical protein